MSHLCRDLFSTILETPGLLFHTMSKKFAYSKLIYEDINNHISEFKAIIYNEIDTKKEVKENNDKTPQELLDEAGYILYECHSEEDIQKFKKYYAPKEELCTFRGGRLESCHVFFAVKKNVDEIKREDFKHPERQDEYGTSVISIQFTRGNPNTLSIKNRYNHTVSNPDATFSNNLENIIDGLTWSFERTYNLKINSSKVRVDIPGFVLANDGKYYKYNFEEHNVYYCPDNMLIRDFEPRPFDKSEYILIDKYFINLKEKTIREYLPTTWYEDEFCNLNIKKIEIKKNKEEHTKEIIINDDIIITVDETNQIIKYKNHHIGWKVNRFLYTNLKLRELDTPNIEEIGDDFLKNNLALEKISLPRVKRIGKDFLYNNKILKEINLPSVEEIRENFLYSNKELLHLNLPNLKWLWDKALRLNEKLESLKLPKVWRIEKYCFETNKNLKKLCLPEAGDIGDHCFEYNEIIERIILPKVWYIGKQVFCKNRYANKVFMPKLEEVPDDFLKDNDKLYEISLPSVKKIGNNFLENNESLRRVVLKNAYQAGEGFLAYNEWIHTIIMPKMMSLGTCSFYSFKNIRTIKMPSLVVFDDIMKEVPPTILKRHNEIQEENGLKVIEELKKNN